MEILAGEPANLVEAGIDIDHQRPESEDSITQIAEGLEAKIHLHWCHSVHRRRSDVKGTYRPILSHFQKLKVESVNLESAYPETGELDDLELLPPHLGVGMGVVDVRSEHLQTLAKIETIAELESNSWGKIG